MQISKVLGTFEEEIEKGAKRQFKQTAQAVKGQFSTQKPSSSAQASGGKASTDTGANEQGGGAKTQGQQPATDQFAQEFIEDLYAPSDPSSSAPLSGASDGQATSGKQPSVYFQQQVQKGYTPEEAQKLESLRKRLHDEVYYIPLTRRQQQQEEERPAEKVEREKMEELQHDDDKKKHEPPPLDVQMATNKAERFPGVSG